MMLHTLLHVGRHAGRRRGPNPPPKRRPGFAHDRSLPSLTAPGARGAARLWQAETTSFSASFTICDIIRSYVSGQRKKPHPAGLVPSSPLPPIPLPPKPQAGLPHGRPGGGPTKGHHTLRMRRYTRLSSSRLASCFGSPVNSMRSPPKETYTLHLRPCEAWLSCSLKIFPCIT